MGAEIPGFGAKMAILEAKIPVSGAGVVRFNIGPGGKGEGPGTGDFRPKMAIFGGKIVPPGTTPETSNVTFWGLGNPKNPDFDPRNLT